MPLLGLLASSITQRQAEKDYVYKPKVKLSETYPEWVKKAEAREDSWEVKYY